MSMWDAAPRPLDDEEAEGETVEPSEVCALCGHLLDEFEVGTSICDNCAEALEVRSDA